MKRCISILITYSNKVSNSLPRQTRRTSTCHTHSILISRSRISQLYTSQVMLNLITQHTRIVIEGIDSTSIVLLGDSTKEIYLMRMDM